MLSSAETRKQFLDFFIEQCGHTYVPSAPVVPHGDPTLLFTNAGMNQFKDVFLGVGERPYRRAVNTQKCIRAGGKHNDLDDVGKDTYHHTFFEMLGNWSFGDYFKRDAITWAWRLLTDVWGLDKRRLHATVFAGESAQGLARDDEAADIWRGVTDIDPANIHLGDMKDNFWEMGDSGPCGPCSEIHYDLTPDRSGAKLVNAGTPKVVEIWNLVFIQFNRDTGGRLAPLPAQHVDTGMGFERICAVLQGKTSNYDTDIFAPIFAAIHKVTGAAPYGGSLTEPRDIAYRVLADHIRALTFALSDGAIPSSEGRGYVLRRILRRAVRYGRQTLGIREPFFHRLVDVVVSQMGDVFPELAANPRAVAETIRAEEEQFSRTLDQGILHFNEEAARGTPISGGAAFTLYATYGFPLDLTQLMAQERGLSVDEAGFHERMAEHQRVSRGAAGQSDPRESLIDIVRDADLPATQFLGHDSLTHADAQVSLLLALRDGRYETVDRLTAREEGAEGAVVTNSTVFYAEAGGQVGDTGWIKVGPASFRVHDTIKVGDVTFHLGKVEAGSLSRGAANCRLEVDAARRGAIRIHHTSTHVLNHKLRAVLGDHVQQKGSLVDEERLRFDFSHPKAIVAAELTEIEQLVQADLAKDLAVHAAEAPQEDALKIHGLRAVFGEKYPPRVRVVSIGVPVEKLLADPTNPAWREVSIEFCGGTHLASTAAAGSFVLIGEEAVAKGVRRLVAVAGGAAARAIAEGEKLSARVEQLARASAPAIEPQLGSLFEELSGKMIPLAVKSELRGRITDLQKVAKEQQKQENRRATGQVVDAARSIAAERDGAIIVAALDGADADGLRAAMDVINGRHPESALLLGSAVGPKVSFVARVPAGLIQKGLKAGEWVKEAASVAGGGGGGRPDMAQAGGKDPAKLAAALDAAERFARAKLKL